MVLGEEGFTSVFGNGKIAGKLADRFVAAVEKRFDIEGLNDTAHTIVEAFSTKGETEIQVEVRYTAGEDEYGKGIPFDPDKETREALAKDLHTEFVTFLQSMGFNPSQHSLSVWIIPLYGTTFKMFNK